VQLGQRKGVKENIGTKVEDWEEEAMEREYTLYSIILQNIFSQYTCSSDL